MKAFDCLKSLAVVLFLANVSVMAADYGQVALAATQSGAITAVPVNTTDRYTVVLPLAGVLSVNMTQGTLPNLSVDVIWFDVNGDVKRRSVSGGFNFPYNDSMFVEAGTYHIEVVQRPVNPGFTGTYNIRMDCTVDEIKPNNTLATAQLLPFDYGLRGSIATTSDVGIYQYVVTESGRFSVNATKGTMSTGTWGTQVTIQWLNANNTLITSGSIGSSASSYTGAMDLEAGIYYIRITANGTGTYNLRGNFTATERNNIKPNNTFATAQLLTFGQTVTGFISYQDNTDMFRYVLTEPGRFSVNATKGTMSTGTWGTQVTIQWLNVNNTQITSGSIGSNASSYTGTMDLEAGDYYIRITANGTGTYNLSGSFTPAGINNRELNRDITNPQLLTTSGQTVRGFISYQNNQDMYRYDLTQAGRFSVNATKGTMSTGTWGTQVTIQWLNANNAEITSGSIGSSASSYTGAMDLEAGIYYIRITANGTGTYNLTAFTGASTPTTTVTGVTITPSTLTIQRGFTHQFTSTVTGANVASAQGVTWTVTGTTNPNTTISSSGILTVANNETATSLTVRATSTTTGFTGISGTAAVSVISVPTAPQNFTASPGNGQVTLSWNAPTSNGGSAITSYQVTSGAGWVTASTNTGHTFTGLTNSIPYTFRVRAITAAGFGAETMVITVSPIAPPSIVTLLTPANSAQNESRTPTLTWQPGSTGGTPAQYRVQVSTTSALTSFVVNQLVDHPTTSFTIATALANNTTYHWRVIPLIASSEPENNTVRTFTTLPTLPPQVTVSAPASNATNIALRPTLSWSQPTGVISGYYIYRGTSANPYDAANPTVNRVATINSGTTTTWTHTTDLEPSTIYHWQIVAFNGAGTGTASVSRSFTTQIAPPGAVTVTSPTAGATNQLVRTTLTWERPTGTITGYYIYRGTSANPYNSANLTTNRLTTITDPSITSWTHTSDLPFNTTYHWQIVAYNGTAANNFTASVSRSFTTQIARPGTVTASSPASNAANISIRPALTWSQPTGAITGYYVYMGASANPYDANNPETNRVATVTGAASWTPASDLEFNTAYHWQIVAYNGTEIYNNGIASTSRSFTTQIAPPEAVTVSLPEEDATNVNIRPTLTWEEPTGTVTGYYVYRGTTANPYNPNNPTLNRITTITDASTTSWTHTSDLAFNTMYHWQIVAYNGAGVHNNTASASISFTTQVAPPGQVSVSSPANWSTNIDIRPTLTWEQPTGTVTGYYVYMGSSSNPYSSSNPETNRIATVTGTSNTSWTPDSDLDFNTTYHWQIVAYNETGNGSASWSRSFTVRHLTHTVTYDINGGTGTIPAEQTVNDGSSVTLRSNSGLSRGSFTFAGWNTESDGTGTNRNANTSFTPTSDITLYARWIAVVTYDLNSGTGTTPVRDTVIAGSSVTLPSNDEFSRGNFIFRGWNTNSSGNGTNYDAESSYEPTGSITLFAKWDAETSILSQDRIVPPGGIKPDTDVTPLNALTSEFTAGPNPVARSAGEVNFFRQGKRVQNATLTVFDASGNVISKVKIVDNVLNTQERRPVGSWDLTDSKGRLVSEGTYLVRGTVVTSDGKRERVSVMVGIR